MKPNGLCASAVALPRSGLAMCANVLLLVLQSLLPLPVHRFCRQHARSHSLVSARVAELVSLPTKLTAGTTDSYCLPIYLPTHLTEHHQHYRQHRHHITVMITSPLVHSARARLAPHCRTASEPLQSSMAINTADLVQQRLTQGESHLVYS